MKKKTEWFPTFRWLFRSDMGWCLVIAVIALAVFGCLLNMVSIGSIETYAANRLYDATVNAPRVPQRPEQEMAIVWEGPAIDLLSDGWKYPVTIMDSSARQVGLLLSDGTLLVYPDSRVHLQHPTGELEKLLPR